MPPKKTTTKKTPTKRRKPAKPKTKSSKWPKPEHIFYYSIFTIFLIASVLLFIQVTLLTPKINDLMLEKRFNGKLEQTYFPEDNYHRSTSVPAERRAGTEFKVVGTIINHPYSIFNLQNIFLFTDNCQTSVVINGVDKKLSDKDGCDLLHYSRPVDLAEKLKPGYNLFWATYKDNGHITGFDIVISNHNYFAIYFAILFILFISLFIFQIREYLSIRSLLIITIFLSIGTYYISTSYTALSQTYDEPAHISTGMQWLKVGKYHFEPLHPPLSRIAAATLLYLDDVYVDLGSLYGLDFFKTGNEILHADPSSIDNYKARLAKARMGILPFFIILGFAIWAWAYHIGGMRCATLSIALYSSTPTLLGHAGLATTDFVYAAMITLALFCSINLLHRPNLGNFMLLGASYALTMVSKVSALGHLSVGILLILLVHFLVERRLVKEKFESFLLFVKKSMMFSLPIFALFVVSIYLFTEVSSIMVAVQQVTLEYGYGNAKWLLGKPLNDNAVFAYFPVGFFYKSSLVSIILIIAALVFVVKSFREKSFTRGVYPLLLGLGTILTSATLSPINIGIRHILPAFSLLSIAAGYGAYRLLDTIPKKQNANFAVVGFLVLFQLYELHKISPDQFTYFNQLAGDDPRYVLVDTDLDWGQDLFRLDEALKEHNIKEFHICYFGHAWVSKILQNERSLTRDCDLGSRRPGWFVSSHYFNNLGPTMYDNFWLKNEKPFEKIGRSLYLYNIR